ncbi:universal stress protein [Serpentinicella alkaliphila]|uniref:Nucleotide-binding universal stress UspA family protein n=1 Tax=Serpentinicella alkaliphila TaxID=1734049 RepID=A0A4R2TXB4_9FIRM|nr:universal stress protein [Serpentinicella alkaliphila]QUH25823.1 universal stress protein [Serpentinicella alkaliphila]TCP99842.1 nucleotide-binding universal stress UspA family protein [Serpentinicella alkaliphila]
MKILVCTDGSKESLRAIEKACKIAAGCEVHEVSVINVYEGKVDIPTGTFGYTHHTTDADIEMFKKAREVAKEKSKKSLLEAEEIFKEKNIKVNAILKEGPAAEVISEIAEQEGFDLIVIGRRGINGLKKLFLGSVSNAVLQQANTSVLIVK